MRDKIERPAFLQWAKNQYHAEDFQQRRQAEDLDKGGPRRVRAGMHSRWGRELQRRLGTAALWHMVTFTGKVDVTFLDRADGSTQTVAPKPEPQPDLTRQAQQARDRLRWAESLARKKAKGKKKEFTRQEQALLDALASGHLRTAASEATRKSGWGRIKHEDGTFEDISRDGGGIVRTILDNVEYCDGLLLVE